MDILTKIAQLICAWASAIGAVYLNREAIQWVVTIWKRTWKRFRGTVLPIPDDALAS